MKRHKKCPTQVKTNISFWIGLAFFISYLNSKTNTSKSIFIVLTFICFIIALSFLVQEFQK